MNTPSDPNGTAAGALPVSQTPPELEKKEALSDNAKTQGQDELLPCPLEWEDVKAFVEPATNSAWNDFAPNRKPTWGRTINEEQAFHVAATAAERACKAALNQRAAISVSDDGGSDASFKQNSPPAPSLPTVPPAKEEEWNQLAEEATSKLLHASTLHAIPNRDRNNITVIVEAIKRSHALEKKDASSEATHVGQDQNCPQCYGKGWSQSTRNWQPYRATCTMCHGTRRVERLSAPSVGAATDSESAEGGKDVRGKDALPGDTFETQNARAIADHAARNVAHEWLRDLYESSNGAMSGWTTDEMSRYHENLGLLIDFVTTSSVVDGLRSAYASGSPKSGAVRGQVEGELWRKERSRSDPHAYDIRRDEEWFGLRLDGFTADFLVREVNASIQRLAPSALALAAVRYGGDRLVYLLESERSKWKGDNWDYWNCLIEKVIAALAPSQNLEEPGATP